jgi:hypothetical protein
MDDNEFYSHARKAYAKCAAHLLGPIEENFKRKADFQDLVEYRQEKNHMARRKLAYQYNRRTDELNPTLSFKEGEENDKFKNTLRDFIPHHKTQEPDPSWNSTPDPYTLMEEEYAKSGWTHGEKSSHIPSPPSDTETTVEDLNPFLDTHMHRDEADIGEIPDQDSEDDRSEEEDDSGFEDDWSRNVPVGLEGPFFSIISREPFPGLSEPGPREY